MFLYRESIKRQAYLVLEENKVLQDQLNLQTNQSTDIQKAQIQESKLFFFTSIQIVTKVIFVHFD